MEGKVSCKALTKPAALIASCSCSMREPTEMLSALSLCSLVAAWSEMLESALWVRIKVLPVSMRSPWAASSNKLVFEFS